MSEYREKNAAYALNSYTWKLLEANLGWKKVLGVPPIIPVQQQPEMLQSNRAFIVYGSAIHPASHLYVLKKEAVSYLIYGTGPTEVNRVCNLLSDTFERQDEAAYDVNEWLAEEALHRNGGHRGVFFTTVKATMVEKAEDPADDEGSYTSGLVLIEAEYTTDKSNIQTSGFTY